jgi:hypothetical protein
MKLFLKSMINYKNMTLFYLYIQIKKNMITKTKITISVDNNSIEILDKYCDEKFINKSKLINHLIKEFLEKNNIEKNV